VYATQEKARRLCRAFSLVLLATTRCVLALPPVSTYSLSVFDRFQAFRGSTLPFVSSTLPASSTAAQSWASVA